MSLKRKRTPLAVPSPDPLPDNLRVPSTNPDLYRLLSKLSRPTLCDLAVRWCSDDNIASCAPYLSNNGRNSEDDDAAPYAAADSLDEIEELYRDDLPRRKGTKREVIERILEGDWRHGLSLRQIAMAESAHVLEHGTSLRWAAFRLLRSDAGGRQENHSREHLPRFHAISFLLNLQREIAPLAKAHYYTARHPTEQLTLVRISLHSTPYSSKHAISTASETAKTIFLAFAHSTPYVYISLPTLVLGTATGASSNLDIHEAKSVQTYVVAAIPRALSRAGERYELTGTQLAGKGLGALLKLRGNNRTNAAAGAWSVYTGEAETVSTDLGAGVMKKRKSSKSTAGDEKSTNVDDKENIITGTRTIGGLTDFNLPNDKYEFKEPTTSFKHSKPTAHLSPGKRRALTDKAEGRFGISALSDDEANIQRFDVKIEDTFSSTSSDQADSLFEPWIPSIKLSFQGSHVFAGLRKLAEYGIIDPEKMPSWLTGEAGVSVGVVRGGRMEGYDELETELKRGSGKES